MESPNNDMALRYPIGKFTKPASISSSDLQTWINTLALFPEQLATTVQGLSDQQKSIPYRLGGWSVAQVIHHLADSHLNCFIRFKLALTEDCPTIKPYIEGKWAMLADGADLDIEPSLHIIRGVHARWVKLLHSFEATDWEKTFIHPESQKTSVLKEVLATYAWHSNHHLAHIKQALSKG